MGEVNQIFRLTLLFLGLGILVVGCSRAVEAQTEIPSFSPAFRGDYALKHCETQVQMGPRIPTSKAHALCADWIEKSLLSLGFRVEKEYRQIQKRAQVFPLKNIIAQSKESGSTRYLLVAHYDTRPCSGSGANDGASGVAVLLEIARIYQEHPFPFPLDFLFLDAQDQGNEWDLESWSKGAQAWAASHSKERYAGGVLLTMVGHKDAQLHPEVFSSYFASDLQKRIYAMGKALGHGNIFRDSAMIERHVDDHFFINNLTHGRVPLLRIGDYRPKTQMYFPEWHSAEDELEVLSEATLQAVGQTIVTVLYSLPKTQ